MPLQERVFALVWQLALCIYTCVLLLAGFGGGFCQLKIIKGTMPSKGMLINLSDPESNLVPILQFHCEPFKIPTKDKLTIILVYKIVGS